MTYLLDTNVCIAAMRGVKSVVDKLAQRPPSEIAVSTISCYELYTGVEKCAVPSRERAKVVAFLTTVTQVAFDTEAAAAAARIRAELERRGEMIGPYDVLVAGQAEAHGMKLVTANLREFSRIAQLHIENWEN